MGLVLASILIFFLFLARLYFDDIDPSGRKEACLLFLALIIALALLLLIFAGFFRGFRLMVRRSEFIRAGL